MTGPCVFHSSIPARGASACWLNTCRLRGQLHSWPKVILRDCSPTLISSLSCSLFALRCTVYRVPLPPQSSAVGMGWEFSPGSSWWAEYFIFEKQNLDISQLAQLKIFFKVVGVWVSFFNAAITFSPLALLFSELSEETCYPTVKSDWLIHLKVTRR